MGYRVVVSDKCLDAPGFKIADDFFIASTYDEESTVREATKYHKKHKIDGVMTIAADVPKTVAGVAHKLGLFGISKKTALLTTDKVLMKDNFKKNGIPIPWYREIKSIAELELFCGKTPEQFILKPADSRGARGVIKLSSSVDLKWAFNFALAYSPSKRLILEQFIYGPQLSTETLVIDGVCYTCGISDRNYEFISKYAPFVIENGGELPSKLHPNIIKKVKRTISSVAKSIAMQNGVLKGDIVIDDGNVVIIEAASRLSGGYFCSHEIPLNSGIDFLGNSIKQIMEEKISLNDLKPQFNIPVVQRYFFPERGRVTNISGSDKYSKSANVAVLEIRTKVGDIIAPMNNHPARAGMVITTGKTKNDAKSLAENIVRNICIEIKGD